MVLRLETPLLVSVSSNAAMPLAAPRAPFKLEALRQRQSLARSNTDLDMSFRF